ncbi:Z1 domain-containing protein [Cellulosimicrobium cellulans]|uniref:Z1 domain-containing protein n=1 Tax=Cellulosimicrobium cellulans TaxID=1710 RepID=UPI001AD8140D|nr:Z1 domain-containing protein [Cellulosimicrobium cellulans]
MTAPDPKYTAFLSMLETKTPVEAIKDLQAFGVPAENIESIRLRFDAETQRIKELDEPRVVTLDGRTSWYTGPRANDRYWPAVVKLLKADGWTDGLDVLDDSSTRVVSLLNHPKEKTFRSRGLVVGHVQSGKTTNFTAVIAKAADRGYKFVIVLSGIHNGLRRQTQRRLEQQLVEPNPGYWHPLTTLDQDFVPTGNPAGFFGPSSKNVVLCVVKKNATRLRKLAVWLAKASKHLEDTPTLIIDDEADQATVATKTINPLIREIMDGLPRSVYIGYTATPFANLLIDPSAADLYPRDFVVSLKKPDGHFGTEVIFGRDAVDGEEPDDVWDGYDMVRTVEDHDVPLLRPMRRVDVDGFAPTMVPSLRDAVRYFLLSTAARRVRGGGNPHSTMLIHTSVNTAVHLSYRRPLLDLLVETSAGLAEPSFVEELRRLWESECEAVEAAEFGETPVPFDALFDHLPAVLKSCRVIMDNSSSENRLDYESGPVVAIAVGGNTLSRGLTLEGLSVSFFVRAVSAYDTLLQMGRWFGFRNGYADLPRIWMTAELESWFRHLAVVEHEMRADIDRYMTENLTPTEFAVRIQTHPALLVTAAAKMKDAVPASASYGGQRLQTHYFHTDAEWLGENIKAARALVSAVETEADEHRVDGAQHVFTSVPHTAVLKFLSKYGFHKKWAIATSQLLSDYISKRVQDGALKRWNVAVIGNTPTGANDFSFSDGVTVGLVTRARLDTTEANVVDIKTLMSRKDAAVDLPGNYGRATEHDIFQARATIAPDTPLLVLYAIDKDSRPGTKKSEKSRKPLGAEEHVIGVGIVFPPAVGADAKANGYIQADLSGVGELEEEDLSILEADE